MKKQNNDNHGGQSRPFWLGTVVESHLRQQKCYYFTVTRIWAIQVLYPGIHTIANCEGASDS